LSLCCCRFPCVELQLQSRRRVTRVQGGASVAAAVEVSDSMLFLRCSVCANVIPACDDTSEHRFCSRCRAVTHMPKLDAAAWDYAGVTPLHAALSREAPPDVALQVTCHMPALPVCSSHASAAAAARRRP
jgi:hypothetical protein